MTAESGYVNVGTGVRISWYVDRGELRWLVAGDDRRVVLRLGSRMIRLISGGDQGEMREIEQRTSYESETAHWVVRGVVNSTREMLERLETFMLLVDRGRGGW